MSYTYIPKPVETKADIDKKIEIEAQNLMYFEYMKKDEAFKEARTYIEEKYKDVVENLRKQGLY